MTEVDRRTVLKGLGMQAGLLALGAHIRTSVAIATDATAPRAAREPMSRKLARFVVESRYDDLPAAVVQKAKEQLVYHFGLAFAGRDADETIVARTVVARQAFKGGASLIGESFSLPVSDAAFFNTTLMRAVWRDDVTWPSGIHAGILTIPPALAVAETRHLSGREMLLAIVLGYEVTCKLARAADSWAAAQPRRPSMVYGGYAPITVAGRLMGLDESRLSNGYGYAANAAMGVPEGGQMQHYYGLLSRNATFAAELAEAGGAPYSPYTVEGDAGLYRSFFGEVPASLPGLVSRLGTDWEILTAAQKRFPGTGQNTVATEVLKGLLHEEGLAPEAIARIDVTTAFADDSPERKRELASHGPFKTWVDAWSSLPYALSVVLMAGDLDPARYAANLENPGVLAAMELVHLHTERGHFAPRWAKVKVTLHDGRSVARDSNNVVYPFPRDAWRQWLDRDGSRFLSQTQLTTLEQMIAGLEDVRDVSELVASVVPERNS
jgi:2-methylcitrate dehydratase PrpD